LLLPASSMLIKINMCTQIPALRRTRQLSAGRGHDGLDRGR
jgi:hypothetical protein